MSRVIIFGGYGVFGSLIASELALHSIDVTIAGRDRLKAEKLAARLGPTHKAVSVNVVDDSSCRPALAGHTVAVHCAGPFDASNTTLLDACLDVGCHYVDIADNRYYVRQVREAGARFAKRGLAAVYGCSSLPAISGALALRCRRAESTSPDSARITLMIGNNNPKGQAAIASLVESLGRPIEAPQGILRGFRGRACVPLPHPFGRRTVFPFETPDYDLLPALLGISELTVNVGFELNRSTYGLAALARLPFRFGRRTAAILNRVASIIPGRGSSGGAIMAELYWSNGVVKRSAIVADRDGQRMAALPCVFVTQALINVSTFRGAGTAIDVIGADDLLRQLVAAGFQLIDSDEQSTRQQC